MPVLRSSPFVRKVLARRSGVSLRGRALRALQITGLLLLVLSSFLRVHLVGGLDPTQMLILALQDVLLALALGLVCLLVLEQTVLRPLRRLAERTYRLDPAQSWLDSAGDAATPSELQPLNRALERVRQSLGAQLRREHSRAEQLGAELQHHRELLGKTRQDLDSVRRELAALSRHDPLTGLANRRTFDDGLRREFKRAQRQYGRLALAVMDLDAFQAYNEGQGRVAGDAALQAFARLLSERFKRDTDLVARLGGEEFAALLPGFDRDTAQGLMDQLREELRALDLVHPDSGMAERRLTVSIGLAAYSPGRPYLSPQALLQAADEALYIAKHAGRDRLSLAV